jgi:hypothetical protein|tara:strand:- start:288 stop:1016 length:729 start_codon:yes stop_codon:yes gene_type:complete
MSKVVTTTVAPTQPGDTVTLGGTGDSVVITNNDIRTNVLQDAGGNAIFTSDGSGTLSGLNSGLSGDGWKLLNTTNASNAANVSFTSLTGYKIFKFVFVDMHPETDSQNFMFNGSTDGGSNYNVTKTTTFFYSYHWEDDSFSGLGYITGSDLAQSTADQMLMRGIGNGSDESGVGELFLFNPASTTYVKHFYAKTQMLEARNESENCFVGGYFNTTSAINAIRYNFASGNMNGTIKQYGLVAT